MRFASKIMPPVLSVLLLLAGGPPGFSSPEARASHAATLLSQQLGNRLAVGSQLTVQLVLRNDGSETWSSAQGFFVAAHWLGLDGETLDWEGVRSRLGVTVPPGATVAVDASLSVPGRPGRYLLQWDLVQEAVCWFSQRDPRPISPVPVLVAPSHAFSVVSVELPRVMFSGTTVSATVELVNDGVLVWDEGGPISVASHWLDAKGAVLVWEGLRRGLPRRVEPGQPVVLQLPVEVPERCGRAQLQVDLVHEGVCWFSQRDPTPEPPIPVWIAPGLWSMDLWLCGCTVMLLSLVAVVRRRGGPRLLRTGLGAIDVVWAAASLAVHQSYILQVAGRSPQPGYAWHLLMGVALVALLLLWLPVGVRGWAGVVVVAAGITLVLADVVHLRFFADVISCASLAGAGQVTQLRQSIESLLAPSDLGLLLDLVCGSALVWCARDLRRESGYAIRAVARTGLVLLMVPGILSEIDLQRADDGPYVQIFSNLNVVSSVGVLSFHVHDVWWHLRSALQRPNLAPEELAMVSQFFAEHRPQRAGTGPTFAAAAGANLLMLQVESLQRYVIGFEINGQEVTPNLNRWRRQCLWFSRVSDQAADGRSSDSELASQTSLLPLRQGAAAFRYPDNDFVSIAEVLAERGYTTLSAVPYDRAFWNRQHTHPAYGFERSLFAEDFDPGEIIGWGLNDRDFLAQMAPRLAALDQPFCAYLITLSLHHPFSGFPDRHKVLDVGRWEGTPFGNYLHTMHFLDSALPGFLAALDQHGMLSSTVIALWGDHGANIEWRSHAEAIGRPFTEPDFFDTERVPLLVWVPGGAVPAGENAVQAGQLDIAPTLLALLGVDPAGYPFMGRNLLGAPGTGPVLLRLGHWLDQEHLYVNRDGAFDHGKCYLQGSLQEVAVTDCRAGQAAAQLQARVAQLVFAHDLQQRLADEMGGGTGP